MEKRYTCVIDNSNWMRAHEKAYLSLRSPTGKTKTFYKKHLNAENRDLMHRLAAVPGIRVDLTIEELELFLNSCKAFFAK